MLLIKQRGWRGEPFGVMVPYTSKLFLSHTSLMLSKSHKHVVLLQNNLFKTAAT